MERDAARELASHLASDERLVWSGSPAPLRYALFGLTVSRTLLVALALLTAMAAVIVLAWLGPGFGLNPFQQAVLIVAMPLPLASAALLSDPLIRFLEAGNVVYGLTDRRAMLLVRGRHSRIEEVPASRFLPPRSRTHRDGTRTLLFFPLPHQNPPGREASGARGGFIGVRNGAELERELIRLTAANGPGKAETRTPR